MNPEFTLEREREPISRRRGSGVQWGAVTAGALAGFGTVIILGALGAAIGITAGAAVADEPVDPGKTAVGFGVGAVLWTFLSAAAAGLVGGWVYSATTRPDCADRPCVFGALTWCAGVALALMIGSFGAGGLLGALGGGAAGIAARPPEARRTMIDRDAAAGRNPERMENGRDRGTLTPEEEARARQAAEDAAKAASAMSWMMLGALLIGVASTMLGASLFHRERETRKPGTRIRPSPVEVH